MMKSVCVLWKSVIFFSSYQPKYREKRRHLSVRNPRQHQHASSERTDRRADEARSIEILRRVIRAKGKGKIFLFDITPDLLSFLTSISYPVDILFSVGQISYAHLSSNYTVYNTQISFNHSSYAKWPGQLS